jgi:cytochrome bd ubiquinol oxidase subunit II
MDLNTCAFLLLAVLLATYAMLDGFDLGVGVLSLFARSEEERTLYVASVGPVWDGNEVWLLVSGNVLFGAFPAAFALVFSGFYLAFVLVLLGFIARGVSIEFRRLHPSSRWTRTWGWAFGLGSLAPAVLLGVTAGNLLRGAPIGPGFAWRGSFLALLNPYALLCGLLSCAFFVTHGALYLRRKTSGELSGRLGRIAFGASLAFIGLYVAATGATAYVAPARFQKTGSPVFWGLTLLLVGALAATPIATRAGRTALALAASSATVALMVLLAAFSIHPLLVPSSLGLELSLDIYNAASTSGTLRTMLLVALVGLPIIACYTVFVYRVFAGPARPAEH